MEKREPAKGRVARHLSILRTVSFPMLDTQSIDSCPFSEGDRLTICLGIAWKSDLVCIHYAAVYARSEVCRCLLVWASNVAVLLTLAEFAAPLRTADRGDNLLCLKISQRVASISSRGCDSTTRADC
jgi:hypothetical protein